MAYNDLTVKRLPFFLIVLGLTTQVAFADTPETVTPPTYPLHKVLVWLVGGTDPANIKTLELDILEVLANHNVAGKRFAELFPHGLPASTSEAITLLQKTGCDSVLVLRRRSSIRWTSPDGSSTAPPLADFISDISRSSQTQTGGSTAPIVVANPASGAAWEINKGEGLVFDLGNGKMLWHGDTYVKSAKNLRSSFYYEMVAEKVGQELTDSGLIPPGKKTFFIPPVQ